MIETPTANFSGSQNDLFSPSAIRALMRAEFERARRYEHPLACFVVEVYRLEQLTDFYGYESREEVMDGVVEVLVSRLRVGDFLGYREEDRFVLALPFTPAEGARALARRLLEGVRELVFDCDGRTLHVAISIGASYSDGAAAGSFQDLVSIAQRGAEKGQSEGGSRIVEWKPEKAEPDLEHLRQELEERTRFLKESLSVVTPAPASIPTDLTLAEKLRELLERAAATDTAESDNREEELQQRIQDLISQHNRQIDVLERRIGKLTCSLEATEDELRRMALLREVDSGIASVYRTVQGLDAGQADATSKRDMMSAIFEANMELHDEITCRAQS